jgi:hypothetical protein
MSLFKRITALCVAIPRNALIAIIIGSTALSAVGRASKDTPVISSGLKKRRAMTRADCLAWGASKGRCEVDRPTQRIASFASHPEPSILRVAKTRALAKYSEVTNGSFG